ncbi:MAG: arginine--tRNA ligase [Bacilli bacterium]|nr:arginine--tRNA ligase [Bacilli bacterium]
MNLKTKIKDIIYDALTKMDINIDKKDIVVEIPKQRENGDFSSSIALKLCKELKMNPIELAESIKSNIEDELIDEIEIAKPGFINFRLNRKQIFNGINEINKLEDNYGKSTIGNNEKINVEYVSANPTGILHLGTARGAAYGDSLCNILSFAGYDVTREYYINDAGNQIDNLGMSILVRYKELCGIEEELPENGYHGVEIIKIAEKIKEEYGESKLDEDIEFFKNLGLNTLLDQIKKDLKQFRVEFDIWTSEKDVRKKGRIEESLEILKKQGDTYEKDGALYLKTTKYGDDKDRVLIKSDGLYTYFTPDIAYHLDKIDRGYDKLIDVLGADHHGYVSRLKASIKALGYDDSKLTVKLLQLVRLIRNGEEVKMSKRTGKTVTITELIDEVGVDAARYFFSLRGLDTQMDFDIDLATKNSNENPMFYVQYAHARICSILRDAKEKNIDLANKFDTSITDSAYNLISKVYEFNNVVEEAAIKREPHLITNYLYELATLFHSYYAQEKILTDDIDLASQKLAIINTVKITIKNALLLIGVEAKERM